MIWKYVWFSITHKQVDNEIAYLELFQFPKKYTYVYDWKEINAKVNNN